MTKILLCLTAAAALTLGGQALAQAAKGSSAPPAAGKTPPAAEAAPPAAAATAPADAATPAPAASADSASKPASAAPAASLTVGLVVKDNTGAAIGQIAELKSDPSGKQMATIKMGTDSFAVATASLAVQDGAAVINLTQQQLKAMIKKPAG